MPGRAARPPSLGHRLLAGARQAYWDLLATLQTRREPRVRIPSSHDLFDALTEAADGPAAAKAHARAGELALARSAVCRHFAMRTTPRFFATPAEVQSIARDLADRHPEWLSQAALVAEASVAGFRDAQSGAFSVDWNALPRAPGSDTLAWHRPHQLSWVTQMARARVFGHGTDQLLALGLRSWMSSVDRSRHSPAYGDALIAVHRGVSLSWALQFLLAVDGADESLLLDMLRVLLGDARFVHRHLGKSYPNNHLLADGFFCWYAGLLFPEFAESTQWRTEGEALWLAELRRQVLPDGSSFEHSVHYHEMVCEMLTAYVLLCRRNGIEVPGWVDERARNMLAFQAALGGVEAVTVPIGDAIEDTLFALDDCNGIGSGSHRELLRRLYVPQTPPLRVPGRGLQRAIWLTGSAAQPVPCQPASPETAAFPDGGVFVMGQASAGHRLVFRTGPGRDAPLTAGHMHADLLSVSVVCGGVPVLVDPGTYTYRSRADAWPRGEPPWRRHFMSPQAHSGPCLGDGDPLDRGEGDFPAGTPKSWVTHDLVLPAGVVSCVSARIDGGTAYSGHRRTVLQLPGACWIVVDHFPASAGTPAYLNFQFAQGTSVRRLPDDGFIAEVAEAALRLVTANLGAPAQHCGARSPPAGWVSPAYGELQPAPCLRFPPLDPELPTAVALLPGSGHVRRVRCTAGPGADFRVVVDHGDRRDVVHVGISSRDDAHCSESGVEVEGTLAWFRYRGEALEHVVVVGESRCAMHIPGKGTRRVSRPPGSAAGAQLAWNADQSDDDET